MQSNVLYRRHEWNENKNGREGKRKNVFYIEKRAFLCGKSFFSAASKKRGLQCIKTSDSPFCIVFLYRACLLYVYSNLFCWFSVDGDEEDED